MDGSSFLASFTTDHEIRFGDGSLDSFPVSGEKVTVLASPDVHELGSSKLKISNIVNCVWDHRYHTGQLVTIHKAGIFFAYGVIATGKNVGVVRVVQRLTEERVLIKGMKGKIKDLAFAHCLDQIILGVVDEFANLFIYRIEEQQSDNSLKTETLLQINADSSLNDADLKHLRVIWCPYLPEEEGDDDSSSRLLVVTRNTVADVFSLDMVIGEYGNGEHDSANVVVGRLKIDDHRGAITDASFSPDGTAVATASIDGQVTFFQVYMHAANESPRCLHRWSPHDGKPVSSVFFLDNHQNYNPDEQFWKYAITGANCNTEFKIWNCSTWSCLQTVTFAPPPMGSPLSSPMELKVALDLTAKYLLLSDIHRKMVYVLRLEKSSDDSSIEMSFASVSAFATPSAFLSMAILEAGTKRKSASGGHKKNSDDEDSDSDDIAASDSDSEDEEVTNGETCESESTQIRFLLVQPKSLQECKIIFEDAHQMAASKKSFLDSFTSPKDVKPPLNLHLTLSPDSLPTDVAKKPFPGLNGNRGDLQIAANKITLMSPEAFETKIKKEPVEDPSNQMTVSSIPPTRGATTLNYLPTVRRVLAGTSGTSSPSREVADILGGEDGDDEIDLNVEYVVTEERDNEDEMDDSDDEENVFDEIALKKEEEEFANLDKILMKQKVKVETETDETDDHDADDDDDDDDEEGVDPLDTSSVKVKSEILSTSTMSGVQIKQESLYASPGHSGSIIKLEPLNSPGMTSQAQVKQEINLPMGPPLTMPANFHLPPTSSILSRSFDMAVPSSVTDQLNYQHNQQMSLVLQKLADMASLIQTQRAEIQVLRQEVRALHSQDIEQMDSLLKSTLQAQTETLAKRVASSGGDSKAMVSSVSQAVHNSLGSHLEREVKNMAPFVAQITASSITQNLNKEVKGRLSQADEQLRNAILKMSQSKPAMEAMGQALASSLHPILQSAFRDMFSALLVPAFERAIQSLLENVRTSINKGYKEYEAQLRQHMGKQLEPATKELRDSVAKLVLASGNQQPTATVIEKQMKDMQQKILSSMQDLVVNEIQQAVQRELSRSHSATPSVPSGVQAATPVNDPQAAVGMFLRQSKWNDAFQTALTANNLSLVLATCEQVNPGILFTQPTCPLTQSVLLSLIQQLSFNLEDKTELKHKYLENAIINLDMTNQVTKAHVGPIASRLHDQLSLFFRNNPESPLVRQLRMLQMATLGFITDK